MKKKDQIIHLALTFVKKESFTHLSFEQLAQQLNITKTAIHYYFKTKNDLGIALCQFLMDGLEEQYSEYQKQGLNDPLTFLEWRMNFIAADEVCPISSFQSDFNEFAPELQAKITELSQLEVAVFRRVIAKKIGEDAADYKTRIFLSVAKGSLFYTRTTSPEFATSMRQFLSENY